MADSLTDSRTVHVTGSLSAASAERCGLTHTLTHTHTSRAWITDTKSDKVYNNSTTALKIPSCWWNKSVFCLTKPPKYQGTGWEWGWVIVGANQRGRSHVTLTPVGLWVENTRLNQWHSWSQGSRYSGKEQRNVAYSVHVIDRWPGVDERSTFQMIKPDVSDDSDSGVRARHLQDSPV